MISASPRHHSASLAPYASDEVVNPDYERPERLWGGKVTHEFLGVANADKWATACKPRAGTRFVRALQMHAIVRIRLRKAGSIAANERGAFDAAERAAADP